MNQNTTLQHLEYMETGFEISKILAQAGIPMDKPAFFITWGQIAEEIAHTLVDYGLSLDRLRESHAGLSRDSITGAGEEDFLYDLAQGVQKILQNDDVLFWRDSIRTLTVEHPALTDFLSPLDIEDDEGPLTEQYENATRIGDDEAYWVDGGTSADFFEDF